MWASRVPPLSVRDCGSHRGFSSVANRESAAAVTHCASDTSLVARINVPFPIVIKCRRTWTRGLVSTRQTHVHRSLAIATLVNNSPTTLGLTHRKSLLGRTHRKSLLGLTHKKSLRCLQWWCPTGLLLRSPSPLCSLSLLRCGLELVALMALRSFVLCARRLTCLFLGIVRPRCVIGASRLAALLPHQRATSTIPAAALPALPAQTDDSLHLIHSDHQNERVEK